jgi:hypothetical protein
VQRVAALGPSARAMPTGRLLEAAAVAAGDGDSAAAARVLLDGGRDLGDAQRYAVGKALEAWKTAAGDDFPAAAGLAGGLHRAWVRRYGDRPPRAA